MLDFHSHTAHRIRGAIWSNLASLTLMVVPPVAYILATGLVSNMLKPNAVHLAAEMADQITVGSHTVRLQLCDAVVQEHLFAVDF